MGQSEGKVQCGQGGGAEPGNAINVNACVPIAACQSQVAVSQVEPSFPLSLALSLSSSMWAAAAASAATTH